MRSLYAACQFKNPWFHNIPPPQSTLFCFVLLSILISLSVTFFLLRFSLSHHHHHHLLHNCSLLLPLLTPTTSLLQTPLLQPLAPLSRQHHITYLESFNKQTHGPNTSFDESAVHTMIDFTQNQHHRRISHHAFYIKNNYDTNSKVITKFMWDPSLSIISTPMSMVCHHTGGAKILSNPFSLKLCYLSHPSSLFLSC